MMKGWSGVKVLGCVIIAIVLATVGTPVAAHVSEQGFVLLLPTKAYIAGGVLAVALTVVLLGFVSDRQSLRLFNPLPLFDSRKFKHWQTTSSLVSLCILLGLLIIGLTGSRDPLSNPFPLFIWTVWWIGLVSLQGITGDLWRWINPWTGLHHLIARHPAKPLMMPQWLGVWPATVVFLAFIAFALADPAPDDPARLAVVVSLYYLFTLAGMWVFGAGVWLGRVECFSVLLRCYALLAPVAIAASQSRLPGKAGLLRGTAGETVSESAATKRQVGAGMPGWAARNHAVEMFDDIHISDAFVASIGVFVLVVLASGSFDGLNETFWWLSVINVNPLEFPGRTAIIKQTLAGLFLANAGLILVFAGCVGGGIWLAARYTQSLSISFLRAFGILAIGILPIALAYHIAHYLTAFLVNGQYAIAALSDPMHVGSDFLGLGTFYVTTGFFNTHHTVHIIWLVQAGAVVLGHVLSVLLTHALAVKLLGTGRKAVISQIPLALFMVLYTLLGLWLLASPRGA